MSELWLFLVLHSRWAIRADDPVGAPRPNVEVIEEGLGKRKRFQPPVKFYDR